MTVTELIGFATGVVGIPPEDLYPMDMETLDAVIRAWNEHEEQHYRTSWEQTRFLAHCLLTPYTKKKLKAEDIIRFPWEGGRMKTKEKPRRLSPEELRKVEVRLGF